MSPMRDGTNKQTTSEDSATQLLIWETLSLAIFQIAIQNMYLSFLSASLYIFKSCQASKLLLKNKTNLSMSKGNHHCPKDPFSADFFGLKNWIPQTLSFFGCMHTSGQNYFKELYFYQWMTYMFTFNFW